MALSCFAYVELTIWIDWQGSLCSRLENVSQFSIRGMLENSLETKISHSTHGKLGPNYHKLSEVPG